MVSTPGASQRFVSHCPPPQSSTRAIIDPIHLRLLDKTRLCHLDSPQPRQRDTEVREGAEGKAQSIHPVCAQSCWGSALEAWTEHKIPARNDLYTCEHNSWKKFITPSSRAVSYIFEDMLLCSIHLCNSSLFPLAFYHFSRWLININSSPTTEKNHSSISLSYPELTGKRARNKWDGENGQEITL